MKRAYPINRFLTELHQRKPWKLLVFSVGNPSPKFDSTKHSVGHLALEHFIKNLGGLSDGKIYWDSSLEMAPLKDHPQVYMAKSLEYMNNSGKAMRSAIKQMGNNYRIIVVHDDIDTSLGAVKFKLESRQMGAHGGLNSITKHYPDGFARIRIGIGSPPSRAPGSVASYVLKKWTPEERDIIMNKSLPDALLYLTEIVAAMDRKPKFKQKKTPPSSPQPKD